MEGFNTKRELDKHITDKHIFICGECLKTFMTKEERVMHMKMDHKDVSTKTTKQEKLLAEEYRKRESTEEEGQTSHRNLARRCGQNTQPRRNSGRLKKEKEKENLQQHRPEKRQNVPRETTEMRMKTTSLLKNQVVRTHHTSQPKRSSREPTRKATSKLYFVRNVFFPCRSRLTQYFYFLVDFNLFSYSTDRLFFSIIESSY